MSAAARLFACALLGWSAQAAGGAAGAAGEGEIYVSRGDHGEVSFSDQAAPGAERVIIETAPAAEDPLAELERRIEQTLAVAGALEESRLARERIRAEERAARAAEARAAAPPVVVYEDDDAALPYLYPRPYRSSYRRWDRPHDGRKPPHDRPQPGPKPEPSEKTLSKRFLTDD